MKKEEPDDIILDDDDMDEAEYLQQFVPKVHFEQIPIKNLVSNQDYQRNVSMGHVKRASENFDLYQINPVKVSRRNGINYVFNGQHTIEIVAKVSESRSTPVWCMVYDDLEYEHEADIFANQLKYTKPLRPYEIFMANIEAGNESQLTIRDLVESYGLTITPTKSAGGIGAVGTLEDIYFKYGFHVLDRTLRLICGTWEGELDSFSAGFLMGVAILINTYGDKLKDDYFKDKLGQISVREITRTAKDRKLGSMGFAETFVIFLNRKTKFGLSIAELYKGKKKNKTIEDYIMNELMDEDLYEQEDLTEENEG